MSNDDSPFHRGEKEIQSRLGIQEKMEKVGRKLIRDHMPAEDQKYFARLPLLIVGTVDAAGRPWASVLAEQAGFVHAIDSRMLRVRARPIYGDPLNKTLVDGADIASDRMFVPSTSTCTGGMFVA